MQKEIDSFYSPIGSKKRGRSLSSPEAMPQVEKKKSLGVDADLLKSMFLDFEKKILENLDGKLCNLATKNDILPITNSIGKLVEENKLLKEEISVLARRNEQLLNRVVDLEDRGRRNNLIFKGLAFDCDCTDFVSIIKSFCIEYLGCSESIWINRAHPLGNVKSRTLIAHFPNDADLNFILYNAKKLKGTKFIIHRDFSRETRVVRSRLLDIRKEILKVKPKLRVVVAHDRLIVGETTFKWDSNNGLMFGDMCGKDKLSEIIGTGAQRVINFMENPNGRYEQEENLMANK